MFVVRIVGDRVGCCKLCFLRAQLLSRAGLQRDALRQLIYFFRYRHGYVAQIRCLPHVSCSCLDRAEMRVRPPDTGQAGHGECYGRRPQYARRVAAAPVFGVRVQRVR